MCKIKLITRLILCSFLFIGCAASTQKIPQSIIEEVEQLSVLPDSLLSPEQVSKKKSIFEIIQNYTKVESDNLVTTATLRDFKHKGLSKHHYRYYLKNIREINLLLERSPLSMQEMYDRMLRDFKADDTP